MNSLKILMILILMACSSCYEQEEIYLNANRTKEFPEINVMCNCNPVNPGDSLTVKKSVNTEEFIAIELTIENTGTADLLLTGSPPVAISGNDYNDFEIEQPFSNIVLPGEIQKCKVDFYNLIEEDVSVRITIMNNDSDEDYFSFTIIFETDYSLLD